MAHHGQGLEWHGLISIPFGVLDISRGHFGSQDAAKLVG